VSNEHIPAILYLFCSYPHICQYISYLEIRTGEYPPNFRLLSTSSSFFILNRSFQKGAGAFPYLIFRLQPPIPANDIIITLYEKKVKCLQEVVAVGSYLATPYNYSQNSTLTNSTRRFFRFWHSSIENIFILFKITEKPANTHEGYVKAAAGACLALTYHLWVL